jgi:broad-specificity NMP kinase
VRIVICGGPKTGKTTLSQTLKPQVFHADDYIHLGWSEASQAIADLFDQYAASAWVIEGVACVRALRKWLDSHPTGKPCDRVILLMEVKSMDGYTSRHSSMSAGVHTVFQEIEPELLARGVEVIRQ